MSRSIRALAETRRRGGSVHGAGERRWLDGRLRLERRLLPSAVSATKYAVILLAAGVLVMAARASPCSGNVGSGSTHDELVNAERASGGPGGVRVRKRLCRRHGRGARARARAAASPGRRRLLARSDRRALWPANRAGGGPVPERSRVARRRHRRSGHARGLACAIDVLSPGAGYAGAGLARSARCSIGFAATGTRQDRSMVGTDRGRSGR